MIPVVVTSNVVLNQLSYRNILAHKDTWCYAVANPGANVRFQANYVPENLGLLSTADSIFGVVELRDDNGIVIDSGNTATTA